MRLGLIVAILVTSTGALAQSRLVHMPTAQLQDPLSFEANAGITHRKHPRLGIATGIGDIAELSLDWADWLGECVECREVGGRTEGRGALFAQLKIGIGEGRLVGWSPALALGFRKTVALEGEGDEDAASLFAVASKKVGPVGLHGGAEVWETGDGVDAAVLRPLAGVTFTPRIYPKTTLLVDMSWVPVQDVEGPDIDWLLGWGVEYRALRWATVELEVRHRQGDDLGGSTVLVGLRLQGGLDESR